MQTKLDILINAKGEYQALDETRKRVFSLRAEIGALSSAIQAGAGLSIGAGLVQGLAAVPAAMRNALAAGVAYNAQIETQTASFKALLGTTGQATERIRELSRFAASTPFELPQLVQASRTLQTFGGNALAAGEGLRLIGDASSAVGAPISEVSMWLGRLYAALRQGTTTGEAVQNLTQLGLVSGELRAKLLAMQGQVLSEAQAMDVLRGAFGRYSGAMQEQSATFDGLASTMRDGFAMLRAEISRPLFEELKGSLQEVISLINDDDFSGGLRVAVRNLTDMVSTGIKVSEVLVRFSDVLILLGAAFVAVKIGQQVAGVLTYVKSLGSAQAAEARMVAAVEAEVAALTAKQAAMTRLIELQQRMNALQSLGNLNGGLASAWAPGVGSAAASDALAKTRAFEGMNTAMKAAPALMGRVAAGGRALFAALGGWGTVAVAGVFAIEWWKNWRLESIDALDKVRAAAHSRAKELRDEAASIATEIQRAVAVAKVEAQLAIAKASPGKYTKDEVAELERLLSFLKQTSAERIRDLQARRAGKQDGAADGVDRIDTLLQKQEDALARRARLQKEFNGLTAEEALARRRASEETIQGLKGQLTALRGALDPLEGQRAKLQAYAGQDAPEVPKGTIEGLPAGFQTNAGSKILRSSPTAFKVITDEEAAAYQAAMDFAANKAKAQAEVNASQEEYLRLTGEVAKVEAQIASESATMPKAAAVADYIEVSKEAAKLTSSELEKVTELKRERQLLGADATTRLQLLRAEIVAEQQRVTTMGEGLQKEQALTDLAKKQQEVRDIEAKQAKDALDTALRIAEIKLGAAQRERDAIEQRRVDGRLSVADQKALVTTIGDQKTAINDLITAYLALKTAKGTTAADQAAAADTIAALRAQLAALGKGTTAPTSRLEDSRSRLQASNLPENSFGSAGEAIAGGLMDAATQAGTAWNNMHDSVLNVATTIRTELSSSLKGMITGTMEAGDAVKSMGLGIAENMLQSFTDMVSAYAQRRLSLAALGRMFDGQEIAANNSKQGIMLGTDLAADATRTSSSGLNVGTRIALREGEAAHDVTMTGVQAGAHVAGEGVKTGSTLMGSIGRGIIRVGETIFHGLQVGFRVAAHLAGEVLMTGVTIAQFALRIPVILAESIAYVFKAGVGALSALSMIPVIGPVLGIAAMAGVIAAGIGVVKNIGSRASGGPVTSGQPYLVGEYGPELIIPSESSVVMNHKETAAIADRLGGREQSTGRGGDSGPRQIVLVDSRRSADNFRRGSPMESQIIEVSRRNRAKIFS